MQTYIYHVYSLKPICPKCGRYRFCLMAYRLNINPP